MNIEKLEHSQKKATFDVTADEFEKALDKAFEVCNAKVTVKGFRKGKAPRHVYESIYGVESLFDEALNTILNAKAAELYANEEVSDEIVGRFEPNLEFAEENGKLERGKDFKVTLTYDVLPEVKLPQYKGIEVAKANPNATEEEIQAKVDAALNSKSTMEVKTEQVIAKGDTAKFDFEGSVDGVKFDGGTAKDYELEIGSGQFIPGFEDQMIGMAKDETKDVVVTFPENYGEKSLAGKEAVFKVTIHEVKAKNLPEWNDEFVKSLNKENVNTVEEFKAAAKAEIESTKAQSEKDRQVNTIINNILDNAVVDMPKSLVDQRVAQIRGQYENQAKMYNIPFETFLGLMNITKEKFDEETYNQGARQALFNVIVSEIVEVEKLAPTKEELDERAKKDAKEGENLDTVIQKNLQLYYSEIAYNKLVEFLLANAKEI